MKSSFKKFSQEKVATLHKIKGGNDYSEPQVTAFEWPLAK